MINLLWKSTVLGIIEGITEFLPISSTGHLILADEFLYFADGPFEKMFTVVVQLGAILAVVICFHEKLIPAAMFSDRKIRHDTFEIWFKTIVGVIPVLIAGALLAPVVELLHEKPYVIAGALIVGGVILIKIESWFSSKHTLETFHDLSFKHALLIGAAQCIAVIPGVSRSAATIIGGLACGASRTLAAEYSFFLAVPTMAAASAYSLLKHGAALNGSQWTALGCGFMVSFFVAWAVIAWLMRYIRAHDFRGFGYYRIILGIIVCAWFYFVR